MRIAGWVPIPKILVWLRKLVARKILLEKAAECNRSHIGDGNRQLLTEFQIRVESASRLVVADMSQKLREDMMGEMERLRTEIAGSASSSVQKPDSSNAASACGGTSAANRIWISLHQGSDEQGRVQPVQAQRR